MLACKGENTLLIKKYTFFKKTFPFPFLFVLHISEERKLINEEEEEENFTHLLGKNSPKEY